MHTKVMRDQFEIKDGAIIHTPTGAEFTPVTGTLDSILIWTGEIGSILQTGGRYRYADVFAVMKTIWQQGFQAMSALRLIADMLSVGAGVCLVP